MVLIHVSKDTLDDRLPQHRPLASDLETAAILVDGVHLFLVEKATFCNHKFEIFHNNT